MERPRRVSSFRFTEDHPEDADFDAYSEAYDDEELIDRGFKGWEAAMMRGFKKFN